MVGVVIAEGVEDHVCLAEDMLVLKYRSTGDKDLEPGYRAGVVSLGMSAGVFNWDRSRSAITIDTFVI